MKTALFKKLGQLVVGAASVTLVACGGGGVRWMRRSSGLLPRVRINLREDLLSSVLCGQVPKVLFLKEYVMIKYDT